MARPTPARFYVNSGIVSSRVDIYNLLRPLEKQAVTYRYYRGRDLVASGTGWVERVVSDEPETSSYFTPVSICLNVDSFEHLDFETRSDQLIVYTLVEGDERIVLELAALGGRAAGGRAASSPSTRAASSRWSSRARRSTRAPEELAAPGRVSVFGAGAAGVRAGACAVGRGPTRPRYLPRCSYVCSHGPG